MFYSPFTGINKETYSSVDVVLFILLIVKKVITFDFSFVALNKTALKYGSFSIVEGLKVIYRFL